MTSSEQIAEIEDEIEGATRDLKETLNAVNAKVEKKVGLAEEALHPQELIQNHPICALAIAGAVGFFLGSDRKSFVSFAAPLLITGLGFAFARSFPTDKKGGFSTDNRG